MQEVKPQIPEEEESQSLDTITSVQKQDCFLLPYNHEVVL